MEPCSQEAPGAPDLRRAWTVGRPQHRVVHAGQGAGQGAGRGGSGAVGLRGSGRRGRKEEDGWGDPSVGDWGGRRARARAPGFSSRLRASPWDFFLGGGGPVVFDYCYPFGKEASILLLLYNLKDCRASLALFMCSCGHRSPPYHVKLDAAAGSVPVGSPPSAPAQMRPGCVFCALLGRTEEDS